MYGPFQGGVVRGFTPAPAVVEVTGLSSASSSSATGGTFSVLGLGFFPLQGQQVMLGATPLQTDLVGVDEFEVTIPPGFTPGTYDVFVPHPNLPGGSILLPNAYTVTP